MNIKEDTQIIQNNKDNILSIRMLKHLKKQLIKSKINMMHKNMD